MTLDAAEKVCKAVKSLLAEDGKIHFFGTEPMLSFPVIVAMISWFNENMDKKFKIGMTTNGSLITKEKADYLKENKFGVLLSCDGIAEAHDLHRVSLSGASTHEAVINGWDQLLSSGIVPAIAATVTPDTVKFIRESAAFLLRRSQQFVHFNFDTTHSVKWSTWELNRHWLELANWYNEEGYKLGVLRNLEQVKTAYERSRHKSTTRVTCGACQQSIGIDVDGTINPCHRTNLDPVGSIDLKTEKISWNRDNFLKFRNYDFNECHSCPAYPCSTCYANFKDATGDQFALNPEWCKIQLVKWQVNEIVYRDYNVRT